jgi:phosphoglycolate phosphatase
VRTVIFDLDGTLVDSSADLIAAANACFDGLGLGGLLDPRRDASTAFRGGRAMLKLGFERSGEPWSEADITREYPRLLRFYEEEIDRHTRPYPGAVAAVGALRGVGYRTGICTNKPERLSEILLRRLGLRELFDSLVGADTLPVRKPDPEPYRTAVERAGGRLATSLLVGDTETDRATARASGVACVLVTFGPDGRAVATLEPEALVDDFDALPGIVERLIG